MENDQKGGMGGAEMPVPTRKDLFGEGLANKMLTGQNIEKTFDDLKKESQKQVEKNEEKALLKRINEIERMISRLCEEIALGQITPEPLRRKVAELEGQRKELEDELNEVRLLEARVASFSLGRAEIKAFADDMRHGLMNEGTERLRGLFSSLSLKVMVFKDGLKLHNSPFLGSCGLGGAGSVT